MSSQKYKTYSLVHYYFQYFVKYQGTKRALRSGMGISLSKEEFQRASPDRLRNASSAVLAGENVLHSIAIPAIPIRGFFCPNDGKIIPVRKIKNRKVNRDFIVMYIFASSGKCVVGR